MATRIYELDDLKLDQIDNNATLIIDIGEGSTVNSIKFGTLCDAIKADIGLPVSYVIFESHSNTSYIRIWTNTNYGKSTDNKQLYWCEQGGYTTTTKANNTQEVIFTIPFCKEDSLFVIATPAGTDLGDNGHQGIWYSPTKYNISARSFWYRNDLAQGERIYWEAKGWIDSTGLNTATGNLNTTV